MLSPEQSREAIRKLFRQGRIGDLDILFKTLQTTSPMSVFRRLSGLGYLTSYSHARRFYTLDEIPVFDENGLWQYQGVFFSKHGTLKATVAHMVEIADAGHSHRELRSRLRVHVHNTLLDLVRSKRIGRELLRGLFVYVSPDAAHAALQVACRQRLQQTVVPQPVRGVVQPLVVEVLLEIIHGAQLVSDPADIVARLLSRGIEATLDQVNAVFQEHGLKKTHARRSRSFRR